MVWRKSLPSSPDHTRIDWPACDSTQGQIILKVWWLVTAALWPTDPKFLSFKDLNPLKNYTKNQMASSILNVVFALSKWPHLHRAYLLASRLNWPALYLVIPFLEKITRCIFNEDAFIFHKCKQITKIHLFQISNTALKRKLKLVLHIRAHS